jgi:hypothetical protein
VFKINKFSQYIAFTGIGILASAIPVSAANITFDLDFFNDSGTEVGDGEFSYDDEALTCFEYSEVGDCSREPSEDPDDDDYYNDVFYVENALTNFSATINGEDWSGGYGHWWSDDESGQLPGEQSASRYGISIGENRWFFGDVDFGTRQFVMDFTQSSDTSGEGNWLQNVVPPGGGDPFAGSGTWQATRVGTESESSVPAPSPSEAVPESSTIFGALAAMVFGYLSKRKFPRTKAQINKAYINR